VKPWIVMRARDDMPLIAQTLAGLARQRWPFELLVFDDGSTDGTRQEAEKYTDRVYPVPGGAYVPGRVLNGGMERTEGEFVVFLNSDCTPQHDSWLEKLLAGFGDERVAAVFGRQIPRPDCHPLYARDLEVAFGDGSQQARFRHCFSMAASAIRRSAWERLRFDERLRYSEDIDWTWRARQRGYAIRYAPEAVAMHSHNYSLRQLYWRQFGEGRAEAAIFDWPPRARSLLRYSLLPYGRLVLDDWKYCLTIKAPGIALRAPLWRLVRVLGRRAGFRAGLREEGGEGDVRPARVG
jgi:rhamnosyltransferase